MHKYVYSYEEKLSKFENLQFFFGLLTNNIYMLIPHECSPELLM